MDPIAIGISVGITVVAQVTKRLMEKASDPENIAKSVNWVFSAVGHFLKVRKGEKSKDTPVPLSPAPVPPAEPPAKVNDLDVEDRITAVQEIAKSLEQETQTLAGEGVYLVAMDNFAMEQLANEVASLINQLETYLGNLRFEEEKAAQYGGLMFAPPIVMNTIRIQQEEIAKRVRRLNKTMQQAYGVAASSSDIDTLVAVTRS
jgi:hypothetical protein